MIYPKPYSVYLKGTIGVPIAIVGCSAPCWGILGDSIASMRGLQGLTKFCLVAAVPHARELSRLIENQWLGSRTCYARLHCNLPQRNIAVLQEVALCLYMRAARLQLRSNPLPSIGEMAVSVNPRLQTSIPSNPCPKHP